jgi:hypothetical protein
MYPSSKTPTGVIAVFAVHRKPYLDLGRQSDAGPGYPQRLADAKSYSAFVIHAGTAGQDPSKPPQADLGPVGESQ